MVVQFIQRLNIAKGSSNRCKKMVKLEICVKPVTVVVTQLCSSLSGNISFT